MPEANCHVAHQCVPDHNVHLLSTPFADETSMVVRPFRYSACQPWFLPALCDCLCVLRMLYLGTQVPNTRAFCREDTSLGKAYAYKTDTGAAFCVILYATSETASCLYGWTGTAAACKRLLQVEQLSIRCFGN